MCYFFVELLHELANTFEGEVDDLGGLVPFVLGLDSGGGTLRREEKMSPHSSS